MLSKFKNKMKSVRSNGLVDEPNEELGDDSWLVHRLTSNSDDPKQILAKDANLKDNDWYDIYDPRSKLSKQRRETDAKAAKQKKMRK
jgi:peptidyl-prolyl cis-trans isomerase SDCCAG10